MVLFSSDQVPGCWQRPETLLPFKSVSLPNNFKQTHENMYKFQRCLPCVRSHPGDSQAHVEDRHRLIKDTAVQRGRLTRSLIYTLSSQRAVKGGPMGRFYLKPKGTPSPRDRRGDTSTSIILVWKHMPGLFRLPSGGTATAHRRNLIPSCALLCIH